MMLQQEKKDIIRGARSTRSVALLIHEILVTIIVEKKFGLTTLRPTLQGVTFSLRGGNCIASAILAIT